MVGTMKRFGKENPYFFNAWRKSVLINT